MKRFQLVGIRQQVVSCLQSYLAETIVGLCFFILFLVEKSLPCSESEPWRQVPFMFPTLFVLTYSCRSLFTGKKSWAYDGTYNLQGYNRLQVFCK